MRESALFLASLKSPRLIQTTQQTMFGVYVRIDTCAWVRLGRLGSTATNRPIETVREHNRRYWVGMHDLRLQTRNTMTCLPHLLVQLQGGVLPGLLHLLSFVGRDVVLDELAHRQA